MPGAPCAPAASRAKQKARKLVTAGRRKHPAFPARMVLTVSSALSLVNRAFLPPSPARCVSIVANLTPASGRRDHTASPSASRSALVRSAACVHRILPAFVTIAKRPLVGRDGWRSIAASTERPSGKFSIRWLDNRCKSPGISSPRCTPHGGLSVGRRGGSWHWYRHHGEIDRDAYLTSTMRIINHGAHEKRSGIGRLFFC